MRTPVADLVHVAAATAPPANAEAEGGQLERDECGAQEAPRPVCDTPTAKGQGQCVFVCSWTAILSASSGWVHVMYNMVVLGFYKHVPIY
jgi:hypothetical protein